MVSSNSGVPRALSLGEAVEAGERLFTLDSDVDSFATFMES